MTKCHAIFSPSSSEKWINCPASLAMELNLPEAEQSKYSTEGILAHKIAEKILKNLLYIKKSKKNNIPYKKKKIKACEYIDKKTISLKKTSEIKVTIDMAENIQKYIDKVWKMSHNNELFVEQRVNFSSFISVPKQFGTSDAIIIANDELQIHDLKYGFVKVYAKNNTQLQLYALGALKKFKKKKQIKKIRICIHQPRLNYLSEWITNIEELFFFAKQVKVSVINSIYALDILKYKGNVNFLPKKMYTPGIKQCRWCKASGGLCKAELNFHLNTIKKIGLKYHQLNKNDLCSNNILNEFELSSFFLKINELNYFIKKIKNKVTKELIDGKKIPGLKLVRKIAGKRIWKNELSVIKILEKFVSDKKTIYKNQLVSPYQIEKIISKKLPEIWQKLQILIIRSQGKIIAVSNKDPRASIINQKYEN